MSSIFCLARSRAVFGVLGRIGSPVLVWAMLAIAISLPARADIGPGFYKAVGGAGLERNICWRAQELDHGVFVWRGIPISNDTMFEFAQNELNYIYAGSEDGNVIFVRDKRDRRLAQRWVPVPCPPPQPPLPVENNVTIGGGTVETTSTTTIKSPTDKQRVKQDPTQAIIFGRADLGRWFAAAQVTFAGSPHGDFTDTFLAFPGAGTSATVTGGQVYGFNGDVGYTVWSANGWTVGVFGGYYTFNEELSGTFPGFPGTFALLNDHWQAGEGGVNIDKVFSIGGVPVDLNVAVAGQYDNLRSGAFNGNGGGVRVNGLLSFPLSSSLNANIHVQYANLNASGSNTGVPLTFNDEVWVVGAGISYRFGASANPAAPLIVKAPISR